MRLERYLNEEYVTSTKSKYSIGTWDIYKNPSPKEINELKKVEYRSKGFRILADFDQKDIYVANNNIIHLEMMKALPQLKLKSNDYVKFGSDRFMTFSTMGDDMKSFVESDTINYWRYEMNDTLFRATLDLHNKDWDWLGKWFTVSEVKKLVIDILKYSEKRGYK